MTNEKRAKIIACLNEGGGLTKSALTYNFAWELSKEGKVLMVDMDAQESNLTTHYCGITLKQKEDNIQTLISYNDETTVEDTIKNIKENLDLIPANYKAGELATSTKLETLKNILNGIRDQYDYIFIDAGPNPDNRHVMTMIAADYLVIPMSSDLKSLTSYKGLCKSMKDIASLIPNLKILGMVFTKYQANTKLCPDILEAGKELMAEKNSCVFDTLITRSIKWDEYQIKHVGICDYAKTSESAIQFSKLVDELKEKIAMAEKE